jgi:hypothetical protein
LLAPGLALGYALLFAALCYFVAALAVAPLPSWRKPEPETPTPRAYLGPTALAMAAALLFLAAGVVQLASMFSDPGGFDAAVATTASHLREWLATRGVERALAPNVTLEAVAGELAPYAPTALAGGGALLALANLYLAARSVQISQRLPRPWRDIPSSFALPRWLGPPTLAAVVIADLGFSPFNEYALVIGSTLTSLYTMQGLATLHHLSRRAAARPFMLSALYFACTVANEWVLPAVALVGLFESFANLRARAARSVKPGT